MSTRFVMTPASFGATHAATTLRDIVRQVAHIHAVHVSRRELADLEPRLLQDIGVSPREALTESGRAPWDLQPAAPCRRGSGNGRGNDGKLDALRTGLRLAIRRWRSRQRIGQLDQHALRDIGVTYAEAEREANKPFWQR
jgi:uncharacterized protein YjiS (DUF1127 family)